MNRNKIHSKDIEIELEANYAKLCGKYGQRNGDGDLSESDVSDDESLEAQGGFISDDIVAGVVLHEVKLTQFIILKLCQYESDQTVQLYLYFNDSSSMYIFCIEY